MPNEAYQALFGALDEDVRAAPCSRRSRAPTTTRLARLLDARRTTSARSSATSAATTSATCSTRSRRARETTDRPTVVFAYTIKGYGLEIAGRPQNHSALLTGEQIDRFRDERRARARHRVGRIRAGDAGGRADRGRARGASTGASDPPAAVVPRPRLAHRARPAGPDLDAGGVRPRPARPLARRGRGRAARHGRRPTSPSRRTSAASSTRPGSGRRRGARLRRDGGLAAEVARRADGPAHRDGHRRDEPRPAARPARPDLGLPAGAALPDRHRSTTRS